MPETLATNQEAIERLNKRLAEIKAKAELAITDKQSLLVSQGAKLDLENYILAVEAHFAPEVEKAKRLNLTITSLLSPAKDWLKALIGRQRDYASNEKRKAQEEERRINEENAARARKKAEDERIERERVAAEERKAAEAEAARVKKLRDKEIEDARKAGELNKREADKAKKAADEQAERDRKAAADAEQREKSRAAADAIATAADVKRVKVEADLPKGAGAPRNQTYYYAEVTNAALIISAFEIAVLAHDTEKISFLRRFIQVNEQEIGKFARDTRDDKKTEAALPGVRAWSKG